MLKATEKIPVNKNENGRLSLPDQGKAEAIKTITENAKSFEPNTWVKHFPTCAKPGQRVRSQIMKDSLPTNGRSSRWETSVSSIHAAGGGHAGPDGYRWRRKTILDLIRHTMLLCGADAPQERAPRGNIARELSKAIASGKGEGEGRKQEKLKRWRRQETKVSLSFEQAHVYRN